MVKDDHKPGTHEEYSLIGTFVLSVLLLGGFLALAWLSVFFIFISRS